MANGELPTSVFTKIILGVAIAGSVTAMAGLFNLAKTVDVLAAEKLRNEKQISELEDEFSCLISGGCGDRQTRTMTLLEAATRDEQHKRIWDAIKRLHHLNNLSEEHQELRMDHQLGETNE